MKPRIKLAESTTPDGAPMALYAHDGAYSICTFQYSNCGTTEQL